MSRRKVRKVELCVVTLNREERDLVLEALSSVEGFRAELVDRVFDRIVSLPLITAKIEEN